jgi:nitrite reductase/ring-hydroxylating ferredoxin subunit
MSTNTEIIQHFDLLITGEEPNKLGCIHAVGTYWIWAQTYSPHDTPLRLLEWTAQGIADITTDRYSVHVVKAGVAHRIEGLFGYWLVADADHIWIQAPRSDGRRYVLIAGGKTGVNRTHTITWYCPSCGHQLGEAHRLSHDGTPAAFLEAQAAVVEAFNASVAARTCRRCATVHPPAYAFRARAGECVGEAGKAPAPASERVPEGRGDAAIARVSELQDGKPVLVTVDGDTVVLVRIGERVHALSHVCPHRGGPLGLGEVREDTITCPWHRFRFDLSTGRSLTNPMLCVKTYPIRIEGDCVFLDSNTATRAENR